MPIMEVKNSISTENTCYNPSMHNATMQHAMQIISVDIKVTCSGRGLHPTVNCKQADVNSSKSCNFKVGSKASLKLNNKPAVWKLDDTVEAAWGGGGDDETIDDNQLLDEDDLKKPDQKSLRGIFEQ